MTAKLAAKVAAVNQANAAANSLYPQLRAVFEPLVGQTVIKVDGSLTQKVKNLLPALPNTTALNVYYSPNSSSLVWHVKACVNIRPSQVQWLNCHTCVYYEISICVGFVRGQILTNLVDWKDHRTNYTVEEVAQNIKAIDEAKNALNEARSRLCPFDETDD